MSQNSVKLSPRQLTVMVFKDNLTARTFRIPLRWITQFSWLLLLLFMLTAASTGLAIRYFLKGTSTIHSNYLNSSRVTELENQLKEAQTQLQALIAKDVTPEASAPPIVDPAKVAASSPLNSKPFLFKGLPDQIQAAPNDVAVPIAMTSPVVSWDDKTLKVKFNLEYVSSTPGGQQGRLFLLARGPGVVYTYPAEVIQPVGTDSLFNPNKGEYFSVSRFRETKASFGPIPSKKWVNEVEVVVLSSSGQMLIHRKLSTNIQGVQKSSGESSSNDAPDPQDTSSSQNSPKLNNASDDSDTQEPPATKSTSDSAAIREAPKPPSGGNQ